MTQASQKIMQQYIDGGVIPARLEGQDAVSKTYVDGQLAIRDKNISNAQNSANDAQSSANTAQKSIDDHKISTNAHPAQNITYSGKVTGAGDVKQAIDSVKTALDQAMISGDSGPEALAARYSTPQNKTYPSLKDRLDAADLQLEGIAINAKSFGAVGDGVFDNNVILQAALDAGKNVFIPEGTYYTSKPLSPKAYKRIYGAGANRTKLITDQDISIFEGVESEENAYLTLQNLTLIYTGTSPSTKPAIKLDGQLAGTSTGPRYCLFEDLYIQNFYDGFWGCGFWCTEFRRVRTAHKRGGIVMGPTTNDITIDDCVLLEGENGIIASTYEKTGGAELTSIHIYNTNIERSSVSAVRANAVQAMSADNLHTEACSVIFELNGTPQFTCNGGRFIGVNYLASIRNSYTSPKLKGTTVFRDALVQVIAANTPRGIINFPYQAEVNTAIVDNVSVYNDGAAKMLIYNQNCMSTVFYGPNKRIPDITTASGRIRYGGDKIDHVVDLSTELPGWKAKLIEAKLVVVSGAGTTTSSDEIRVVDSNSNRLFYAPIASGTVLTNGQEISMGRGVSSPNFGLLAVENGQTLTVTHTNTIGIDTVFRVVFTGVRIGPNV